MDSTEETKEEMASDVSSYSSTSHEESENPVKDFLDSFGFDNSKVERYKRHRTYERFTDKAALLMLVSVIFGGGAIILISIRGLFLTVFAWAWSILSASIVLVNFLSAASTWKSDLTDEIVACYEIGNAIREFSEKEEPSPDVILHHLKEAKSNLESTKSHQKLSADHKSEMIEYLNRLVDSADFEENLHNSFPRFLRKTVTVASSDGRSGFGELARQIQTPPSASEDEFWEGVKKDLENFVMKVITGKGGAVTLATLSGLLVWRVSNPQNGLSSAAIVLTLYGIYSRN